MHIPILLELNARTSKHNGVREHVKNEHKGRSHPAMLDVLPSFTSLSPPRWIMRSLSPLSRVCT